MAPDPDPTAPDPTSDLQPTAEEDEAAMLEQTDNTPTAEDGEQPEQPADVLDPPTEVLP